MTVKPVTHTSGVSRAEVCCDICDKSETFACSYVRGSHSTDRKPNESQARGKAIGLGWSFIKGKMRCPTCEASRKVRKEIPQEEIKQMKPVNVTELRKPTPKQKREIIGILEDVYDDDAKRYRGKETDKTVAETIGGGVMPGWVAEIREDMFGPAGANEEMDNLTKDIQDWIQAINTEIHAFQFTINVRLEEKQTELNKRIEAIKKAVGPRAASA